MDYIKWAKEYEDQVERIAALIQRLAVQRSKAVNDCERAELSSRYRHYSYLRREMESTASILKSRAKKP